MYYRCVSYGYPDLETFPTVIGGSGFVIDRNGSQIPTQVFPNQIILDELGIPTLAQLDNSQVNIIVSICYWQHIHVYLESYMYIWDIATSAEYGYCHENNCSFLLAQVGKKLKRLLKLAQLNICKKRRHIHEIQGLQ